MCWNYREKLVVDDHSQAKRRVGPGYERGTWVVFLTQPSICLGKSLTNRIHNKASSLLCVQIPTRVRNGEQLVNAVKIFTKKTVKSSFYVTNQTVKNGVSSRAGHYCSQNISQRKKQHCFQENSPIFWHIPLKWVTGNELLKTDRTSNSSSVVDFGNVCYEVLITNIVLS